MYLKPISLFLLGSLMLNSNTTFAQDNSDKKQVTAKASDIFMLQLHYDGWANQSDEDIKMKGLNRGVSAYIMYDMPFKNANMSFALGLGAGTHNYYLDNQRLIVNENNDLATFRDLTTAESSIYKKMKVNTAYLEAPFELRYFANKYNRNKGFKAALGLKVGYLLGAHTKEKVNNINQKFGGAGVRGYFQTWSFSPTLRIGWGNFSVFGQYNLSQQFTSGLGPEIYPFSIGITLSGL